MRCGVWYGRSECSRRFSQPSSSSRRVAAGTSSSTTTVYNIQWIAAGGRGKKRQEQQQSGSKHSQACHNQSDNKLKRSCQTRCHQPQPAYICCAPLCGSLLLYIATIGALRTAIHSTSDIADPNSSKKRSYSCRNNPVGRHTRDNVGPIAQTDRYSNNSSGRLVRDDHTYMASWSCTIQALISDILIQMGNWDRDELLKGSDINGCLFVEISWLYRLFEDRHKTVIIRWSRFTDLSGSFFANSVQRRVHGTGLWGRVRAYYTVSGWWPCGWCGCGAEWSVEEVKQWMRYETKPRYKWRRAQAKIMFSYQW